MLDKEINIRFTLRGAFGHAWVPPVLFVLLYVVASLIWMRGDIRWADINWVGWIQAVGSLIAIAIAIAVPARQWRLAQRDRKEEGMRVDYQKALMALRACLEVDEFLANLLRRAGGDRNSWHDDRHFVAKIASLQQRIAGLISVEKNARWWNMFLDAQELLMEINSAIKLHGFEASTVQTLAKRGHENWNLEITKIRAHLAKVERAKGHILHADIWEDI